MYTILVAPSEPDSVEGLVMMLAQAHHVICVDDSLDIVEAFNRRHVDMMILELCGAYRDIAADILYFSDLANAATPIVGLIGQDPEFMHGPVHIDLFKSEFGLDHVFTEPYDFGKIYETVAKRVRAATEQRGNTPSLFPELT